MITKPLRFKQIVVNMDHIYGLDEDGEVWYRDNIPKTYTTSYTPTTSYDTNKEKEKKEQATVWKHVRMDGRIDLPAGLAVEIPPAPGVEATADDSSKTAELPVITENKDEDESYCA